MFTVQDQPDPSRDFHRLLNLPPAADLEVFNDTQLASPWQLYDFSVLRVVQLPVSGFLVNPDSL